VAVRGVAGVTVVWLHVARARRRWHDRRRSPDRCEHCDATGVEVCESIAAGGARVCLDCHWRAWDAAERRRERIESFFSADPFWEAP
jgi:hypothetical protein